MPRTKTFDEKAVLEKAMELFWTQGYHATSIQDLVDHLGINRASLYDTYGGKESLFQKAFRHYREQNTARIKQFLEQMPEVREGLGTLFNGAIKEAAADADRKGCFVVNTATELIPGDPTLLQVLAENKRTFEQLFYDYLKKGEETGQFPAGKNLRAIASLLFTLYNGLKVVSKVTPDPKQYQASIDEVLRLLD
ncbi:MAG: TetR/AcrR family transcriptional regulator [Robiginitalea sp.]|nr:TetR/AcrR family transcriptional regulator [Robiginitalea sp.]